MDIRQEFRVGPWAVSPLKGEIVSAEATVHLEPKVMEVLVALAEKAESVVLRDELLEKVWGDRATVADEPLTRCIAQLRQALGDSSRDPKYVQTVPRRGYRLMVPATPLTAEEPDRPAVRAEVDLRQMSADAGILQGAWQKIGVALAILVLGLVAYSALPLMLGTEDLAKIDPCNIEQVSNPLAAIDQRAMNLCRDGVRFMSLRDEYSLYRAMDKFREAIEIDDEYGSAYVQLARTMVLLPTYAEFVPSEDCWYDENEDDQADCYDGALKLLNRARRKSDIQDFIVGIEMYIFTKQREWLDADGAAASARSRIRSDADMWQWLSQFYASVGNLERAYQAIEEAINLDPDSGVNRERKGVLLMWLHAYENNAEAKEWFDLASDLDHNHYEAAWLVLNIRLGNWHEVTKSLQNHARATREEAPWIDVFVEALKDESKIEQAVAAVEAAIEVRQLHGQYAYGAWVFLGKPDRAIDAALKLIEESPEDMDVEFLFAPEAKFMRQHERFGEIVKALKLDVYWADDADHCPSLFRQDGEEDWCEKA